MPANVSPDLERLAAEGLAALLLLAPVGGPLPTTPYAEVFVALESVMTDVLLRNHAEWKYESIDGLQFAHVDRVGEASAALIGTCILITDQTVTPFALELTLGSASSMASFRLRLGEPGGGALGISGPGCHSTDASTLRMGLPFRVDQVDWTYEVGW